MWSPQLTGLLVFHIGFRLERVGGAAEATFHWGNFSLGYGHDGVLLTRQCCAAGNKSGARFMVRNATGASERLCCNRIGLARVCGALYRDFADNASPDAGEGPDLLERDHIRLTHSDV